MKTIEGKAKFTFIEFNSNRTMRRSSPHWAVIKNI